MRAGARDVEVRVLLAGEGCTRQVLGGGRRPHRDTSRAETGVCLESRVGDHVRHRRRPQPLGCLRRSFRIDARRFGAEGVGTCRKHEPVGNPEAGLHQVAEVGALAARQRDGAAVDLAEGDRQRRRAVHDGQTTRTAGSESQAHTVPGHHRPRRRRTTAFPWLQPRIQPPTPARSQKPTTTARA